MIENLIEEERREESRQKNKPYEPKKFKYPKSTMTPIRVEDIEEYDEDYSVPSKEQHSQEKPLRMYYAGDGSDEGEGLPRSIENYIDAKPSRSQELDESHEDYLKRRNSIETESEPLKKITNDIDKPTRKGGKLNTINETVESEMKGGLQTLKPQKDSDQPLLKSPTPSQGRPQNKVRSSKEETHEGRKAPLREIPGKQLVESEEAIHSLHDFDPGEIKSSIENDPDMHVLIAEVDVPNYRQLDENSSGKIFPQGPTVRASVFSALDKRKNRPTSSRPHQLSQPYLAQQVSTWSPHFDDMYSFEMLSNREPSDPIVFKTNLKQKHAQRVDLEKDTPGRYQIKGKLGYPAKKNNCKQQGKAHNHLLCLDSDFQTPTATSYQQQEFFRSPGT